MTDPIRTISDLPALQDLLAENRSPLPRKILAGFPPAGASFSPLEDPMPVEAALGSHHFSKDTVPRIPCSSSGGFPLEENGGEDGLALPR